MQTHMYLLCSSGEKGCHGARSSVPVCPDPEVFGVMLDLGGPPKLKTTKMAQMTSKTSLIICVFQFGMSFFLKLGTYSRSC
jgi:hypothetical protein